jgi:hypothetical protein
MRLHHPALAAALLTALPGAVGAELAIDPGGRGDALYLPLYDVAEGRDSLLTVRNTGGSPTAARVVFSEAANGQTVLNFNLFLPAYATWTAAVVEDGAGATLVSASMICTVPSIPAAGVLLRQFDYAENFPDGGGSSRARTRRGAIEVFELGTLQGTLASATAHGACATLAAAYQPGGSRSGALAAPASALAGNVQVVEVTEGVVYALPAVAIRGFHGAPVDAVPGADLPRLTTPQLAAGSSHFLAATPAGRFRFAADRGADAVSSLFMASRLSGELLGDATLAARTQWALAFPTKSAYVADLPGSLASGGPAVPPFGERFGADGSCERLPTAGYGLTGGALQFTVPVPYTACTQVVLREFDPGTGSGSAALRLDDSARRHINAERLDGSPVRLRGLPVVGWRLSRFVNTAAQPGVLANYTVALPLLTEPAVVEAR